MGKSKRKPAEADDELPDEIDFSKLVPIGRGVFAKEAGGAPPVLATYAVVDDRTITVSLGDGRKLTAPLDWYPRLGDSTPAERNNWRLILGGRAVLWPDLGQAIAVKSLLEGERSTEPAASLRQWRGERGKKHRKTA